MPLKFVRIGVEGIEDGGSGNRESPRLMVLSAIAEALVSTEAAETCRDSSALCFSIGCIVARAQGCRV